MKALKIVTIITFAVLVCGVVSITFRHSVLAEFGWAYRNWLLVTLLYIILVLGWVFCVMLWIIVGKTSSRRSRTEIRVVAGIIAGIYTPVCLVFSVILGIAIWVTNEADEWIMEEGGVKYVVERDFGHTITTQYPYINDFVRGNKGAVIDID